MEETKMFENENDFKKIVESLNVDTEPKDHHRQGLRRQMLSAFSQSRQHRISWHTITKLAAAAVVIVAIGLFLVHRGPNDRVETPEVVNVAQSPAKMMTAMSLTLAYHRGGLEAVEEQCDKATEMLGPRPKSISIQQLLEDFNGENSERTKL
jgi:hypothetical protein